MSCTFVSERKQLGNFPTASTIPVILFGGGGLMGVFGLLPYYLPYVFQMTLTLQWVENT